ncbi:MAG: GNAT family N-acetyltransferase [Chloroflexi bacterium]|nr:GNAT family N-acetyltransferase [Chloroflexota bacterium]MBI3762207.1 GNAT family N-acetyltransferase [Chloroflexota bacterium]
MPRLVDRSHIRAILETDRPWSLYALGDLSPGFFEHCEWIAAPGDPPGLALLYRAFDPPVLFALGGVETVGAILDEIGGERKMYLSIPVEILPLVKSRWAVTHGTAMWRMILAPAAFQPAEAGGVDRLGPSDLPDLRRLYADGAPTGEAPDFFHPSMLEQGVFFGIREAGDLVAAAGTHLVSIDESVGAVGNVYTRRDRRGRGLAARVAGAVSAELVRLSLSTIGLNVNQRNEAAIRVYERLGYVRYCPFCEGMAESEGA